MKSRPRFNSRPKLQRILNHYFDIDSRPISQQECPEAIEVQIQQVMASRRWQSKHDKDHVEDTLRLLCMLYPLLLDVNHRRPKSKYPEFQFAQRLRKLKTSSPDTFMACELNRLSEELLRRQKVAWDELTWSQQDAVKNLTVELGDIVTPKRFRWAYRNIANLVITAFDWAGVNAKGERRSPNDDGDDAQWVRQIVQRHRMKRRNIQTAMGEKNPNGCL